VGCGASVRSPGAGKISHDLPRKSIEIVAVVSITAIVISHDASAHALGTEVVDGAKYMMRLPIATMTARWSFLLD